MTKEKKKRQVSPEKQIRPGMILVGDAGYSMQIPVFYEVLSLTPSGKSARIRELSTNKSPWDQYGGRGSATPEPRSYIGEEKTRRIQVQDWVKSIEPYEYVRDGKVFLTPWKGDARTYDYMN